MRNQQTNTQDDGVPCTSQGRFDTDSSDFYDQVANWIPDCLAYVVNLIPGCLAVRCAFDSGLFSLVRRKADSRLVVQISFGTV